MVSKNILLEQKLEEFKQTATGSVFSWSLSDLVMMQMVGDFDEFLSLINSENSSHPIQNSNSLLEETRKLVTSEKLFESIVKKTIEAQFGDKYAALRELGQNAIDSYDLEDESRPVSFALSETEDYFVLKVEDWGCGMNRSEIVRNLFIPYNSGKELNPSKIGEHGIGWFSIVDLADLVKITTKSEDGSGLSQALVFNQDNIWQSFLSSCSDSELNEKIQGTEVCAYIPKEKTSEDAIQDYLFNYLGMVGEDLAQIKFGNKTINSCRSEYNITGGIPVEINGQINNLTMGVSKRLMNGGNSDERFRHRDCSLNDLLYTQRGLFIKNINFPFHENTIHYTLARFFSGQGLEFWIDLPKNVTLTKGRNGIVGDDELKVLEATYKAFESLYLDVILNDDELNNSSVVIGGISAALDRSDFSSAKDFIRQKYSLKRRMISRAIGLGNSTVNLGAFCLESCGTGISKVYSYFRNDFLGQIQWAGGKIRDGAVTAYNACVGSASFIGAGLKDGFKRTLDGLINGFPKRAPKEEKDDFVSDEPLYSRFFGGIAAMGSGMFSWSKNQYVAVKDKCFESLGLYVDVENKRKRKIEAKRKKISDKYLSKLQNDDFFGKILDKKIISAEYHISVFSKEYKVIEDESFGDLFEESWKSDKKTPFNDWENSVFSETKFTKFKKKKIKLSINELVELYTQKKIKYKENKKDTVVVKHGDFFVNYKNPLIAKVIDHIELTVSTESIKYDAKVLEDYLDNMGDAIRFIGLLAYIFTPVGWIHAYASSKSEKINNPFKGASFYEWGGRLKADLVNTFYDEEWRKKVKNYSLNGAKIAGGLIASPVIVPIWLGNKLVTKVLIPAAKALDPRLYPDYYQESKKEIKSWFTFEKKENKPVKPPLKDRINKFFSISGQIYKWYEDSIIHDLIGLGIKREGSFKNVPLSKLERACNIVEEGRSYVHLFDSIDHINKLVGQALDKPAFEVLVKFTEFFNYSNNSYSFEHGGFSVDNKGGLHVDIGHCSNLVYHPNYSADNLEILNDVYSFSLTLLDLILHQRAHFDEKIFTKNDACTKKVFERKAEYREKVMNYLEENNIDLADETFEFLPALHLQRQKRYYCLPKRLSQLIRMSRRRLWAERDIVEELDRKEEAKKIADQYSSFKESQEKYSKDNDTDSFNFPFSWKA